MGLLPTLRLAEFDGVSEYVQYKFDDFFVFSSGKNIKQNEASPDFTTPCVRYGELYHMYGEVIRKTINSTNLERSELTFSLGNEILLPSAGEDPLDIGSASALTLKGVAIGRTINVLRPKGNIDYSHIYVSYYINEKLRKKISELARGASISNVYNSDLKTLKACLPALPEQQKIASFLSKVDEKIGLLSEKKAKLTEYKKGVMQQLFSGKWVKSGELKGANSGEVKVESGKLTFIPPTLRFKADDGSEYPDWDENRLGDVFTRIRNKNKENNQNVLTISAQHGLINQQKYFNKSVAAKDVTGYYLLENGDFAYNKSYSKGYPMGAIKRLNNYDKGVVSTLYICFGLNKDFVSDFFEHYFESGLQNRDLSKIAQEGARNHGLLNISVDEFFKDVKLLTPIKEEQIKIADFLSAIDQKIELANSELAKAKEWKKGLLQQMFV